MENALTEKQKAGFTVDQTVVYPGSGIGTITSIVEQEVGGTTVEMYKIAITTGEAVLVPTNRIHEKGLRTLSDEVTCAKAVEILGGKAGNKNAGVWQKRQKERDQQVNSGDLQTLARLVRDLYSADKLSYAEQKQYEKAVCLLLRELALVWNVEINQVEKRLKQKTSRAITYPSSPNPSRKLEAVPSPLEVGYAETTRPKT